MINFLSDKLVNWLTKRKAIQNSEAALYRYAAYNCLYTFIPVIPILSIAYALNSISGGILFFIAFILLRKYTGGFHFQSPGLCLFVSLLSEFLFILLAKVFPSIFLWSVLFFISSISLCILSPVESAKRELSLADRRRCQKQTTKILVSICLFCYLLYWIGKKDMIPYPASAVLMTAISQYPAIILEKRKNNLDPHSDS